MITTLVYRDSRFAAHNPPADTLATLRAEPNVMLWVDLAAPTEAEIKLVLEIVFAFHPLAIEDCVADSPLPKLEEYDDYLYLVMHAVDYSRADKFTTTELDLFLGKNFLVTFHRQPLKPVQTALDPGNWNWCMAPIYDEKGKLHVFNSIIPLNGSWVKNSRIGHYVADRPEGPYEFVGNTFASDEATYHNPQVSKVGDVYVLVFMKNQHKETNRQEVGLATANSLDGPWKESPLNPVIPASGKMAGAEIIHASNPTLVAAPDGRFRIYYKSMTDKFAPKKPFREISLAISDRIEGPYVNYSGNPLISYADKELDIEDPYAFYYQGVYYMIVEDRLGVKDMLEGKPVPARQNRPGGFRPGLIYSSKDGIHWGEPKVAYQTNEFYFGAKLARSERPHILWKKGKPECLFLACHDDDPTAGYFLTIKGWDGEEMGTARSVGDRLLQRNEMTKQ